MQGGYASHFQGPSPWSPAFLSL